MGKLDWTLGLIRPVINPLQHHMSEGSARNAGQSHWALQNQRRTRDEVEKALQELIPSPEASATPEQPGCLPL